MGRMERRGGGGGGVKHGDQPCVFFGFYSRRHRSAWKSPCVLLPVFHLFPQSRCPNSSNFGLVEHGSFPSSVGATSTPAFLHSSLLRAISAVMHGAVPV